VLSDPERRKKCDQQGKDWQHTDEYDKAKRAQSSGQRASKGSQNVGYFSNFFESMFGSGTQFGSGMRSGRQAKFRGEDF
jgi:curved DNA-binding protein